MLKELTILVDSTTVLDWVIASGAAGGTLVVLWLLRWLLVTRLKRLASRTSTNVDDVILEAVRSLRPIFLIACALYAGSATLPLGKGADGFMTAIFTIVALIQAGLVGNAILAAALSRQARPSDAQSEPPSGTLSVIRFIGRLVVWSVVLLLALDNLGVNVTGLLAGLGVGGIAVALALQNILGDLFASLSITLDRPFVVGDFVVVGEFMGSIENVGWKTTRIRSLSGEQLVFSNTDLLQSRIRNFKRMSERRVVFTVGVTYGTPTEKVEQIPTILATAVRQEEATRFDRAHFKEFGDSALVFECVYYVLSPDYAVYMDTQQSINLALLRRFRAEGIEFAFPTRTVFLAPGDPLPQKPAMTAGRRAE